MKPFARKFYDSKAWKSLRKQYVNSRLLADGGLCECCHTFSGKECHHVIELTEYNINDPSISLNPKRLRFLCRQCHANVDSLNPVKTAFSSTGELIVFDLDNLNDTRR